MFQLKNLDFELTPFFEKTPDLVCIARKDGYFEKVNQAVLDCLEYSQEELFSRPIASFIHPQDQPLTHQERVKLINGKPLINFQNRYVSKSGKVVWLHWTSIYFADKEVVFAIAKDVTARKLVEKEIEEKVLTFKDLARHFKHTLEKDRKFLATELHEGIAQLASVVKMDMDWLAGKLDNVDALARTRIEHAAAAADLMIQTIRKVSFSISPNMIEDLGLHPTLHFLCREFSEVHGIPCHFEGCVKESDLQDELKLDFFRIGQVALPYTFYHRKATNLSIHLEKVKIGLCLSIRYEGEPLNSEESFCDPELKDIEKRASSFGGQLSIVPFEKGTVLQILVVRPTSES